MYLTAHTAVGILLSEASDEPEWIFVYGFLSHFVLDFLPHGDEDVAEWIKERPRIGMIVGAVDVVFVAGILTLLFAISSPERTTHRIAGVLGALLPDIVTNVLPYLHQHVSWFSFLRRIHRIQQKLKITLLWHGHDWFHRKAHNATGRYLAFWSGIFLQGIVTALALGAFFRISDP